MGGIVYFFKGLKMGIVDFSENIGIFLNLFLLTFVYLFGVGSVFLISRVSDKAFLDLGADKERTTYWEKRNVSEEEKEENFYKQF